MSDVQTSTLAPHPAVMTTDIVCAFVSNNAVPEADLPALILRVHQSVEKMAGQTSPAPTVEAIGAASTPARGRPRASQADSVVHETADAPASSTTQHPAVPPKQSVSPDFITCLEDGKKFKSLKRHLRTHYNLTPEAYRAKWGLPDGYPMVAPNYSKARSEMAKQAGLGSPGSGGRRAVNATSTTRRKTKRTAKRARAA